MVYDPIHGCERNFESPSLPLYEAMQRIGKQINSMDTPKLLKDNSDYIVYVCDQIKEMLLAKDQAYGSSATSPLRIMSKADPVEQIKVRIDDKLSRLARGNANLETEDVINDLIGYFVLLKIAKLQAEQK